MRTTNITIQNGRVAGQLPQVGRKLRNPQHPFFLETRPFGIYPFMISPVLAGDTLKSAMMQSRVVTDPIKNRLIGWWNEYYWFYVKLSDLDDAATLTQMLINPATSILSIDSETPDVVTNFYAAASEGYLNYTAMCLKRVTEEYFRDESETWNTKTVETGIPAAKVTAPGLWRSLTPASSVLLDYKDVAVSTVGNDFTIEELQNAMQDYEILKQGGFVTMSYDDYLAAQGVRVPEAEREEQHVPELLRFARSWQYPISAIDPTNGAAASAVQWSHAERIDKDRFFREPGFVFGVTVCRPKMYLKKQGASAQLLSTAERWLPRVLDDDPTASLLNLADNKFGVNWADAGGVYVDLKDAFLYGDQFTNMSVANLAAAGNAFSPDIALDMMQYVPTAEIDAAFSAGAPDRTNARVRQDGVCTLNILSRVPVATDTSRGVMSSQPV